MKWDNKAKVISLLSTYTYLILQNHLTEFILLKHAYEVDSVMFMCRDKYIQI